MITRGSSRNSDQAKRNVACASLLRPCVLLLVSAAISLACGQTAGAVDWYTGDKTSEPDYAPSVVLDASDSLTSKGSNFGAVALTTAIEGTLAREGFRARVEGIAGEYNYFTTLPPLGSATLREIKNIGARQENAGVLGGYAWVAYDWNFALYGGVEVINTALSYADPNNTTNGLRIGAKIAGEFYGNPTRNTMLSGYGSYSNNNNEYYSRVKAGYRLWGNVFLGPEFIALGNQFYSEYRAGLHLTGITIGSLTLGLSGGATSNVVTGSGGYGIVDARLGF